MQVQLRAVASGAASYGEGFAKAHVTETDGPNMSPQIGFWQECGEGAPGQSYCQYFVYAMQLKSWCNLMGLLKGPTDHDNQRAILEHANWFSQETRILRTGSCELSLEAARRQGRLVGPSFSPSRGDQAYWDLPVHGSVLGRAHHTGIWLGKSADGGDLYVEGNTTPGVSGNQSNGQGVYVRKRPREFLLGFAHFG